MERIDRETPDRVLLLGDLLYHGPRNDLPEGYAPKEVLAALNGIAERIVAVRGNCDAEVDQMVLDFPCLSDFSQVWADGTCCISAMAIWQATRLIIAGAATRKRVAHGSHAYRALSLLGRRDVREPREHLHPQGRLRKLCRIRQRHVRPEEA